MSTVTPRKVEIYGIFCKLNNVNTVQGRFEGEVDIVSSWFDNIHGSYNSEHHWNPQIVFDNLMVKDAQIRIRVETQLQKSETNENNSVRIVQYQKIIGTFTDWLHIKQFPFDVQKIGVMVASSHPTSRITLIAKKEYCYLSQKAMLKNNSWDFNPNISIDYSVYQEQTPYLRSQQYPRLKFNLLIARKSQFYITNLILPLFLVTSTIFVSFTHDISAITGRLATCATTLSTSISFRFIIHTHLPNISYSTYLDYYSMASIFFISAITGWHAYTLKQVNLVTYAQLDTYVSMTFAILYIILHIFFIVFAWILPRQRQKSFLKYLPATTKEEDDNQPIQLDNLLGYERSLEKLAID